MIKPVLHYSNSADGIVSSNTTRHGGVSKGRLVTLNINPYRGDEPSAIDENLQAVVAETDAQADKVTRLHQIHEIHCLTATDVFSHLSVAEQYEMEKGKDAVVTGCHDVCIGVHTADCVPVFFYDLVHHVIGAAHAGRRGTTQRIVQHTFRKVTELHGTGPKELKVIVDPYISLKNFEVGQEVHGAFSAVGFPMGRTTRMYEEWCINLPLCNRLQSEELDASAVNILQSGIYTYDNAFDFFSARILKEGFGIIYTNITLK